MKILIGSDHAGFSLKEAVKSHLLAHGHDVEDLGTYSEESADYPLFAGKVARGVARGDAERGILVCGAGVGVAIAANKVRGVRAAQVTEEWQAEMSRRHNDANVMTLPGRYMEPERATELVDVFLSTEFEGGRHQRRVDQMTDLGESN
jgi:ribose 5-phosphate isomerase B